MFLRTYIQYLLFKSYQNWYIFRVNLTKYTKIIGQNCQALVIAVALTQIYFPYSSVKFFAVALTLTLLFAQFQSTLETVIALAVSFSVVTLSAQLPVVKELFIDQSVRATSLIFFATLVLFVLLNRLGFVTFPKISVCGNIIPSLVMFGTSFYWSASRDLGGLNFLGRTEDNAAWLMGLSFGLQSESGIKNVADLGWAGGPTLGMFNALAMSFQQASLSRKYMYLDNIDAIIRSFGLLLTLILGTAVALVVRFALNLGRKIVVYVPVAIGTLVLVYMGCASVMRLGHYSFLLAIWLMIAALAVPETLSTGKLNVGESQASNSIKRIAIVVLVVTASMSWRAITPVGLLIALYFIVNLVTENRLAIVKVLKKSPWVVAPMLTIAGVGFYTLYVFLGGDLRNGLDLDVLTTILTIEGATETVSVFVLSVLLVIAWLPLLSFKNGTEDRVDSTEVALPLSMISVFVLMMFISYVTEGHGLYYAVRKYELLLAICMIPMAMKGVTRISSTEKPKWISFGFVLFLLSVFFYDGSLSEGLSYPGVDRSGEVVWAKAAEIELRNHPERRVVCLNTSDPDTMHTDIVAYTCNRLLIGLQGLEGNNDYEDWTRLGMWLTDTSRLEALPGSFYESLTFIVLDSEFSRKGGDETFMRVLESIPWNQVKAVDLDGNIVSK